MICYINFVCTVYSKNRKVCSGLHFVLCPKQGRKIEGVAVNRVCFLKEFFCPKRGQDFKPSAAPLASQCVTNEPQRTSAGGYCSPIPREIILSCLYPNIGRVPPQAHPTGSPLELTGQPVFLTDSPSFMLSLRPLRGVDRLF